MFLISLVMLLALANGVLANEFTGATDNRFCDPTNWNPAAVPGPSDEAEIRLFDVVVDCDVDSGTLKGPGWDENDPASLTVNAGSSITFSGVERHEADSPWVLNVAGSFEMLAGSGTWRFADEAIVTWNVSSGGSLVVNDYLRAGDNGGTGWDVNVDSGVLVFADDIAIGDDGGGVWTLSGTASVSCLKKMSPSLRNGSAVFELNMSGDAELAVAESLECHEKDNGDGTANFNIGGGILSVTEHLYLGISNGPGNLNVSGGLVVVGDTLKLGKGAASLTGGEVRTENIEVGDYVIDVNGGALVITGNQLALIGDLVTQGKLTGCGGPRGVVVDYGVTNPGKTTVTSTCDFDKCQAWGPNPADGAIEVQSVETLVILEWIEGDCIGMMGRNSVYFGTDYDEVNDATISDPEWEGYQRSGVNTYNAGNLPLWETFYWRIDQFNSIGGNPPVTKGKTWNFTTGCELINGDVNMDCLVNFLDYAELAATFGMEEFWPE
jgi:hypothetical protein